MLIPGHLIKSGISFAFSSLMTKINVDLPNKQISQISPAPRMLKAATDARHPFEWPTWLALLAAYAMFAAATWFHNELPLIVLMVVGGLVTAFHGSLQHEAIHGHPTRKPCLNELLVFPSPWLWMPYRVYRRSHLLHHRDEQITLPGYDPESFYLPRDAWHSLGAPRRALLRFHNTLLGRLIIGPALAVFRLISSELRRVRQGDRLVYADWGLHAASCTLVLAWVLGFCGMSLPTYLATFAYPGLSLTLLRSFAEHRAMDRPKERTAIVRAGPLFSLLYLNNNLHAIHHATPAAPWYSLPAKWRAHRRRILEENGGYFITGYGEIIRRWCFTAREDPAHPFA